MVVVTADAKPNANMLAAKPILIRQHAWLRKKPFCSQKSSLQTSHATSHPAHTQSRLNAGLDVDGRGMDFVVGALVAVTAVVASWFAVLKRIASGKGGVAALGARLTLQAKREKQ